nr:nucleotide pyrophosphatase/phosphodiesterase 5 [Schistosoma mansoni]
MIILLLICFFPYIERIYASGVVGKEQFSKVILISLDGFRYDYFDMAKQRNINMSAFDKIINQGVYIRRIENEFPTLTFPSHFSIVTGLHPGSHGIVDNVFYDPIINATFSSRNQSTATDSRFYDVGAEPIWVTNQFHGHKSGVTFWIGSEAIIKGERPTHYLTPYNESITFTQRIDILMDWFEHENINLGLMYYHQPDRAGHIHGAASDEVFKAIEEINHGLEYLLTSIEMRPSLSCCLNLIITSDHGMTNISSDRVIYLHDYIHPNEYISAPKKSAEIWTLWPKQGYTVRSLYNKLKDRHFRLNVYLKEELPTRFFYGSSDRVGPVVVYADIGWTIIADRTSGITLKNKGAHGYDPDYKEMSPFLMAMGPQIAKSQPTELKESIKLIDIYSLICLMLDLEPAPNNGSVCRVLPLLSQGSFANINRLSIIFIIKFIILSIFMVHNGLYY